MSFLRKVRPQILRGCVLSLTLCLLVATPLATLAAPLAQRGQLDPDVLAALQSAARLVEQRVGPVAPSARPIDMADAGSTDAGSADAEQPADDGYVDHENLGVTISTPAAWQVEAGSGDTVFEFNDPESGLQGMVSFTGDTFPGLIALPLFETLADKLVQSTGPDAELVDVSREMREDGLPALKITFTGADTPDMTGDGLIYMVGTGDNAYAIIAGAPANVWPALEPIVTAMGQTLQVDESLLTLQTASDDETVVDDPFGNFSVTIPKGWHSTTTNDEDMGLLVADPDVRFAGALGAQGGLQSNDAGLQALIEATAGSLDEQTANELLEGILEEMDFGGQAMAFDPELSEIFNEVGDYLGVLRIGGLMEIDDGVEMPLLTYLGVNVDSVAIMILFGAHEEVLAAEETLLEIFGSLVINE